MLVVSVCDIKYCFRAQAAGGEYLAGTSPATEERRDSDSLPPPPVPHQLQVHKALFGAFLDSCFSRSCTKKGRTRSSFWPCLQFGLLSVVSISRSSLRGVTLLDLDVFPFGIPRAREINVTTFRGSGTQVLRFRDSEISTLGGITHQVHDNIYRVVFHAYVSFEKALKCRKEKA